MKLTQEQKQEFANNLKEVRGRLKQHCIQEEHLDAGVKRSVSLNPEPPAHYLEKISSLKAMEEKLNKKKEQKKSPLSSFSTFGNPLKEVFGLIEDGIHGKLNDYLNEALHNAEVEIKVAPKDPRDANSRKQLDINISVAATMIDKYSGLLEILLNKKSVSSDKHQLLNDAHNSVTHAADRLKRVTLCAGLMAMKPEADRYIDTHKIESCMPCFFSSSPSKQYAELHIWFQDLTQEALSANEIMGAIYSIRDQIHLITKQEERNAIRDVLDNVLKQNLCPSYLKDDVDTELKPYIEAYNKRVESLGIRWPRNFKPLQFVEALELQ